MNKFLSSFLAAGVLFFMVSATSSAQTSPTTTTPSTTAPSTGTTTTPIGGITSLAATTVTEKSATFKMQMRKLWSDHVFWTRSYIVSALANLPDQQEITKRLLKNQEDLGSAIKPYYGEDAGNKLTTLLKTHITTAVDVVTAAKANDNTKFTSANTAWEQNAKDISDFLSSANSQWNNADLLTMMKEHLQIIRDEVNARMKSDWVSDVTATDNAFNQALKMADTLSDGVAKQFPEKF